MSGQSKFYLSIALILIALAVATTPFWFPSSGEGKARTASGRWLDAGQVTQPMTASVKVSGRGRHVQFALQIRDATGAEYRELRSSGSRPKPTVQVQDAQGNSVHSFRLEYG